MQSTVVATPASIAPMAAMTVAQPAVAPPACIAQKFIGEMPR